MNKGFSLIEMLAVIAVIAVIVIITVPTINYIQNEIRNNIYNNHENTLRTAAENYISANSDFSLPFNIGDSTEIEYSKLKELEYISTIYDAKEKTLECDGKVIIKKISETEYSYLPYISCGNNYESTDEESYNNLVDSITDVYNVGTDDYTITLTLRDDKKTTNDAYSIETPDNKTIGLYKKSYVDYSDWTVGTNGTQVGTYTTWSRNGTDVENEIIDKANPWGDTDVVWATLSNDTTSNDDGGWGTSTFYIDNTKRYRYTVWIKREDAGNGRTYVGINGYQDSTNVGIASVGDPDARSTNPYTTTWLTGDIAHNNEWVLHVAYIEPAYSMSVPPEIDNTEGIYLQDGTRIRTSSYTFAFAPVNNKLRIRSYLYYSTITTEKQFWYRPRVDVVDGTEPTIDELLAGIENPTLYEFSTINKDGIITATVPSTGKYTFTITRADRTKYKIYYEVE